eukprot:1159711-Pelagomonas_calceolata.AAC.4
MEFSAVLTWHGGSRSSKKHSMTACMVIELNWHSIPFVPFSWASSAAPCLVLLACWLACLIAVFVCLDHLERARARTHTHTHTHTHSETTTEVTQTPEGTLTRVYITSPGDGSGPGQMYEQFSGPRPGQVQTAFDVHLEERMRQLEQMSAQGSISASEADRLRRLFSSQLTEKQAVQLTGHGNEKARESQRPPFITRRMVRPHGGLEGVAEACFPVNLCTSLDQLIPMCVLC